MGEESGRKVLARLGPESEHQFLEFVNSFASFLVVMPGSPEPKKGPFYLIKVRFQVSVGTFLSCLQRVVTGCLFLSESALYRG